MLGVQGCVLVDLRGTASVLSSGHKIRSLHADTDGYQFSLVQLQLPAFVAKEILVTLQYCGCFKTHHSRCVVSWEGMPKISLVKKTPKVLEAIAKMVLFSS